MKQKKRVMLVRSITSLLILICLIFGTVEILILTTKVVKTGTTLIRINDNIQYYNSSDRKTDDWTYQVQQEFNERESLYSSSDTVVRLFANLPAFLKLLVLLLAIATYPAVGWMWVFLIVRQIRADPLNLLWVFSKQTQKEGEWYSVKTTSLFFCCIGKWKNNLLQKRFKIISKMWQKWLKKLVQNLLLWYKYNIKNISLNIKKGRAFWWKIKEKILMKK